MLLFLKYKFSVKLIKWLSKKGEGWNKKCTKLNRVQNRKNKEGEMN